MALGTHGLGSGDEITDLPVDLLSRALETRVTGVGYLAPDGDESGDPSETLTLSFNHGLDGLGFTWIPTIFYALTLIPVLFCRTFEVLDPQTHEELLPRRGEV